jgi:glutathione synthase/RimK-type ligase-like ATP-grasp enzyme
MIHTVNDKPGCRKALIDAGIKAPFTFYTKEYIAQALNDGIWNEEQMFPLIGRPSHHAQGRKMVVSRNFEELERDATSDYWSEIIEKDREYRVYTFFGRILMVAEKVPTEVGRERLAWNHFGGGAVFNNVRWSDWPIECCKESLKAANVIGIDFAGVDVMEKDGVPYILEINSAHSLTAEYRQKIFAKALSWLIDQIETTHEKPVHFDYPEHIRTYKSLILPYLRGR